MATVVLVSMVSLYMEWVIRVPIAGGEEYMSVVVGAQRLEGCECKAGDSDLECLEEVSVDPAGVATCWDPRKTTRRGLVLILLYVIVMSSLCLVVGVAVLMEGSEKSVRRVSRR